ncbi:hypothetical protein CONPUDRAFT_161976 [Coniophora puteana RWD-64-598 SS2]|uniref:DUF6534 domain-containing protein n=1 Tax=Coniophora puteana (strain RWD-64-598) TaxID=741705 RepID=A0A5M3N8G4_CONPW|nr:uncharacterized protein CONPUDRAFT_161976 [Coniophora puteana RWD-64-598 SS2]EIW87447.1 hypothetical protein CONPUDRAFT_161976 [Coniophora puteana RWD-64-598 SS2]
MVDVPATYGALLLGGLIATGMTGIVTVQSFVYLKTYPDDSVMTQSTVAAVWILDWCHTGLVFASLWTFLIKYFGDPSHINIIPWPVALTVAFTAVLTFIVHSFFALRIYKLSYQNWRITAIILVFAFLRLCSAAVTTAEMIHMETFDQFRLHFRWVFTLGLALSSFVDVLITAFLCMSLQKSSHRGVSHMDRVITSIILYTVENGLVTSATTVTSMICWLVMPTNLIFMGLHFVIGKFYACSLLATLNARKELQNKHNSRGFSVGFPVNFPATKSRAREPIIPNRDQITTRLEISVEKTVEYNVDSDNIAQTPSRSVTPSTLCPSPTPLRHSHFIDPTLPLNNAV